MRFFFLALLCLFSTLCICSSSFADEQEQQQRGVIEYDYHFKITGGNLSENKYRFTVDSDGEFEIVPLHQEHLHYFYQLLKKTSLHTCVTLLVLVALTTIGHI